MKSKRMASGVLTRLGALGAIVGILVAASIGVANASSSKPTYAQPYPWSRTASVTTGDYIADSYNGVATGTVIENVTTDRLLDILSSNGNYYIVFGGPEHPTSQAAIAQINAQAQADGITKIYHFDPYVDGYQLDITDATTSGVGAWTGGTSVNYGGSAKINQIWRLITDRLPSSAVATDGALNGYKGDETLLFSLTTTDRTDVETGKVINASYKLSPADLGSFDATAARTAISAVFHQGPAGTVLPASTRTQYQFFKRLYDASASLTNSGTPTVNKIGGPVQIFSDTDFPGGANFPLQAVDIKQAYNLLNSPGEKAFLFAGQGCHNTQAIVGSVALRAKQLGLSKVYVVDFSLDSNVKFGTGSAIDTASANSATGGLWIRNSATIAGAYKFSYLYGELAKYFGSSWITENSSKRNNSIAYYPNGNVGGTLTTNPYVSLGGGLYGDNPALGDNVPNAKRLQVPTIIAYNKDAAQPVTHLWLHKDSTSTETTRTYTEYMLELAWVRHTQPALDASATYVDGLTRVQFADEAVAALDGVLAPVANYVAAYSLAPLPTITGAPTVGATLSADHGTWFPNPDTFSYQWYADGVAIPGETGSTYQITPEVGGKKLAVKVTGAKPGFPTLGKTSKQTEVVTGDFTSAPTPTIAGAATVGATLTSNPGTWAPTPTLGYQWYANGVAIGGATGSTYKIPDAVAGKSLSLKVTASKLGYPTLVKTSSETAVVTGVFAKSPNPKISGSARIGKTLKVVTGSWSPAPTFTYQWYANGKKISKATKASFKVTSAQKGKRITVAVTAKRPYYTTLIKTSPATSKVTK